MCVSFWFTLFYTFDFPLACLMALIGFLVDNHLLKIKLWIRQLKLKNAITVTKES